MQRILSGEQPSARDWNEHVVEFHRIYPGSTPSWLDGFLSDNSRSSYDRITDAVRSRVAHGVRILDLGCGDGSLLQTIGEMFDDGVGLAGIDLSGDEIALARERLRGRDAVLVQGDAAKLPFEDERFGVVVSHLAIINVIDEANMMREVARVLEPGGLFVAVTPEGTHSSGDFVRLAIAASSALKEEFPNFVPGSDSLRSLQDERSFAAELRDAGFAGSASFEKFTVAKTFCKDEIWNFFGLMYIFGLLDERVRRKIERVLAVAADSNNVRIELPMMLTSIAR